MIDGDDNAVGGSVSRLPRRPNNFVRNAIFYIYFL